MRHTEAGGYGDRDNAEVAHEHSDVNVRVLLSLTVGLLAVVAIVGVLMWGLLWTFQRNAAQNDPPLSPVARADVQMPASQVGNPYFGPSGGPQLLTNEPTVLQKHRQTEEEALHTYGWIDEKSGVARIPIDEAKKLILQRGLPVRAEAAVNAEAGTRRSAYGESSSGRTITAAPPSEEPAKEGGAAAPAAQTPKGHGH